MNYVSKKHRFPGARLPAAAWGLLPRLALLALAGPLASCAGYLPYDGPSSKAVLSAPDKSVLRGIELVPVNYAIATQLQQEQQDLTFSSYFTEGGDDGQRAAPGDILQIYIWEAPPSLLFAASPLNGDASIGATNNMATLPSQAVADDGNITVPFAGQVHVAGMTTSQIAAKITGLLHGKANQPQVLVNMSENIAQSITVIGAVQHSQEVQMIPGGVQLLRALAEAGGVTQPVEQITIQISRNGQDDTLPLQTVLLNPKENIQLQPGDVVTALYQPLHVTLLGATGMNSVLNFTSGQTSLAEALAKAGGLQDDRANAQGVFVFRFEDQNALNWPTPPKLLVHNKVPVIYQFDLSDPATFFAAQTFEMRNQDLIYVSDAPVTSLQKVLNVVGAVVYPFSTLQNYGVLK